MRIHVFWDNSNVWGSAQLLRSIKEPGIPWVALRVYFRNVLDLVAKGRPLGTKVMSGSVPPECEDIWPYAKALGFETNLLKKVYSMEERRVHEQGVDEILHLKMANLVLDVEPPETLVILSGDSDISDFGTSFPSQALRALKRGWHVEVYSAKGCVSGTKWKEHETLFPNAFKIVHLDPFYDSFTFVQGGEYYRRDDQGHKIYFTIADRIVQPLPQQA